MNMRTQRWYCSPRIFLVLSIISVVLLIVSLVLAFKIFPDLIDSEIEKSVKLENGTEQFDRFLELPFPVSFKVYIYNIKNADGILAGDTPQVEEIGPFVYDQHREKTIISINEEDDTVTYTQKLKFTFNAEASGDLSDENEYTIVNPPYNSMLQLAEAKEGGSTLADMLGNCINDFFEGYGGLFIKISVKKILFDGLIFLKKQDYGVVCNIVYQIAYEEASQKRNVDIVQDALKFTYFNYKAREHDGLITVKRGLKDITQLGHITAINHAQYTNYWTQSNSTCDKISGTDSTLYPPHVEKSSVFQIYSTDICRSVDIYYQQDDNYQDIDGYRFGTNDQTLRSKEVVPGLDCFCSNMTKNIQGQDSCFLDGVIDLQPCLGVPVLLSFPHFLGADPSYIQGIQGLAPADSEIHETHLIVEPNTGTPLEGSKKIQLNMVVRPIANIHFLKNTKRTVLPMLWLNEGVALTDKYIEKLNDDYFNKRKLVEIIQWILVGITAAMSIIFITVFIRIRFF